MSTNVPYPSLLVNFGTRDTFYGLSSNPTTFDAVMASLFINWGLVNLLGLIFIFLGNCVLI